MNTQYTAGLERVGDQSERVPGGMSNKETVSVTGNWKI